MDLDEVERRMQARHLLRRAYLADVSELANALASRIRHGEFDASWHQLEEIVDATVLRHPRVTDESLALETVAYSEHRNAVETDFIPGWSLEPQGPWARFEGPIDPEYDEPCELTLPPWSSIAYHAFAREVEAALYAALGDTPFNYLAARLGLKRR
jgi:hypothetical protein